MHRVLAYNGVAARQDAIDWVLDLAVWIQRLRRRSHFLRRCYVSGLPLAFAAAEESCVDWDC